MLLYSWVEQVTASYTTINYAANEDKTDQMMYVTEINCHPDTALADFTIVKKSAGTKKVADWPTMVISLSLKVRARSQLKKLTKSEYNLQKNYGVTDFR